MKSWLVACLLVASTTPPSAACDIIPPLREPTLPEKIGGLKEIYGGTVVGYVAADGTQLMGPLPPQCLDDRGEFDWYSGGKNALAECKPYLDTEAAIFRVDVPIVGPAAAQNVTQFMTWGDGDCNIDFQIGEKWLIAGWWFTQELKAPIRDNEVAML